MNEERSVPKNEESESLYLSRAGLTVISALNPTACLEVPSVRQTDLGRRVAHFFPLSFCFVLHPLEHTHHGRRTFRPTRSTINRSSDSCIGTCFTSSIRTSLEQCPPAREW